MCVKKTVNCTYIFIYKCEVGALEGWETMLTDAGCRQPDGPLSSLSRRIFLNWMSLFLSQPTRGSASVAVTLLLMCPQERDLLIQQQKKERKKERKRKKKVAYSHGSKTAHKGDLGHLFRWARVCHQILYQKVTCLYFDLCKMNILYQSYFCIQDHREWFFRHSTNEDQSKNRLSSMQFWLKNQWPSQGQLKTLLVFKVSFHSKSSLKTQRSYALFQKHEIML